MPEFIYNKKEFIDLLKGNKSIKLKFKKKDGSDRFMNATLNFDEIPDVKKPKKFNKKKLEEEFKTGKFSVFDLDINEWRKANYNTTDWVETESNVRYSIKK